MAPVIVTVRLSVPLVVTLAPVSDVHRPLSNIPAVPLTPRLPPESGAFLTWLDYRQAGEPAGPNDVDLVVNANVLYCLARYGRLDTPGAAEAVHLIDAVVARGLHRTHPDQLGDYYPANFAFHYAVSRAWREGPVPGLGPAVERLADHVERTALSTPDGTVYWDNGAPHLNTALAVLTLMNAERQTPLIDKAVQYLIDQQDRESGGWAAGGFFVARTEAGPRFVWTSSSLTTALAFEALCRCALVAP